MSLHVKEFIPDPLGGSRHQRNKNMDVAPSARLPTLHLTLVWLTLGLLERQHVGRAVRTGPRIAVRDRGTYTLRLSLRGFRVLRTSAVSVMVRRTALAQPSSG